MRLGVKTILAATVLLLAGSQIASAVAEANSVKFPYIAEVTGSNINVRSGAGTNYYRCGKISEPMRVVVVDRKYIWSKILPPQGSFSWIFKQYVKPDANDPRRGSVTANDVSVYAGGENRNPVRCETVQIKISLGDAVQIIESPAGDYYKIVPPEGACLWTSSQYLKFVRDAAEMELKIPEIAPQKPRIKSAAKPVPIPVQIVPQSRVLENYYDLVRQFEDEKAKPLTQQDYSNVKTELDKMVNDPNSGNAGSYSKYLLKQIARCELGQDSQEILEKQQKTLKEALSEINEQWASRKAKITTLGKFAASGILKPSMVYQANVTSKRFLVVDESNNPVCYAEATGDALTVNLEDFTEQTVGLTGEIKADSQSNLALVVFERIEKLTSKK
ncbi:MAG: hypothetical protein K8R02_09100 [Anaerohalosphaeraceae bacterium]|nr:hypothetical protein [Anaerohalosphaeraceae bacterium]